MSGNRRQNYAIKKLKIPMKYRLTPREQDVLLQLCKGSTNKEIALSLRIGGATVKHNVTSLLNKLGCDNRTELVSKVLIDNYGGKE